MSEAWAIRTTVASTLVLAVSLYALVQDWRVYIAWLGLLVTLAGIGCGASALRQNHRRYGKGHLFPGFVTTLLWLQRVLLRKERPPITGQIHMIGPAFEMGVAGHVERAIVPSMPLQQQITLTLERLTAVEQRLSKRHREDKETLQAKLRELTLASEHADREIEKLARDVGAGTVKLQLWGLILVGFGTAFLAVPTMIP